MPCGRQPMIVFQKFFQRYLAPSWTITLKAVLIRGHNRFNMACTVSCLSSWSAHIGLQRHSIARGHHCIIICRPADCYQNLTRRALECQVLSVRKNTRYVDSFYTWLSDGRALQTPHSLRYMLVDCGIFLRNLGGCWINATKGNFLAE